MPRSVRRLFVEKPGLCYTIVGDFLMADPGPTMAPIPRASEPR